MFRPNIGHFQVVQKSIKEVINTFMAVSGGVRTGEASFLLVLWVA
jgi:hypothetical protein